MMTKHKASFPAMTLATVFFLSGCATYPEWLSGTGASRGQVLEAHESGAIEGIRLVDVSDALARKLAEGKKLGRFTDVFPGNGGYDHLIEPGDVVEVSVWEAPPAMLFGGVVLDPRSGPTTTRIVTFPEQMVTLDGTITMPFAGRVPVKKRTTQEVEADIVKRLTGKANEPQVLVRVVRNNTANVTVVGEVNTSAQMPLTPKGERLLDALATGNGVKHPIRRMAIQISRGEVTATMPLDAVIRDPKQNIPLKPGDVVAALFQPQSFSVLGATGKNEEIAFEAQGISLAQALARSGGLNDNRADARGVFVFRFEDARLLDAKDALPDDKGVVPVVYQVNLRDPASFFVTQNFPVQDRDVIYVANSPAAEYEKFIRLLVLTVNSTVSVNRAMQ